MAYQKKRTGTEEDSGNSFVNRVYVYKLMPDIPPDIFHNKPARAKAVADFRRMTRQIDAILESQCRLYNRALWFRERIFKAWRLQAEAEAQGMTIDQAVRFLIARYWDDQARAEAEQTPNAFKSHFNDLGIIADSPYKEVLDLLQGDAITLLATLLPRVKEGIATATEITFYQRAQDRVAKRTLTLTGWSKGAHGRKKASPGRTRFSGGWHKGVRILALEHNRIVRQRHLWHTNIAKQLALSYATIYYEKPQPRAIVGRPEPVKNDKGGGYRHNNAAEKSVVNKAVLDVAWAEFIGVLKLACERSGSRLVELDPGANPIQVENPFDPRNRDAADDVLARGRKLMEETQ